MGKSPNRPPRRSSAGAPPGSRALPIGKAGGARARSQPPPSAAQNKAKAAAATAAAPAEEEEHEEAEDAEPEPRGAQASLWALKGRLAAAAATSGTQEVSPVPPQDVVAAGEEAQREWLEAFFKFYVPAPAPPPARLAAGLAPSRPSAKKQKKAAALKDGLAGLVANGNETLGEAVAALVWSNPFQTFLGDDDKPDGGRLFAENTLEDAGFTFSDDDFAQYWKPDKAEDGVNPGSHYITTKVKNTLNAMVNKVKECVLLHGNRRRFRSYIPRV
jgi:hypothetical protein